MSGAIVTKLQEEETIPSPVKYTCTYGHLQDRMILSIICFIDTNVQQCRGKQIKRGGGGLKRNIDKQEKVRMVISNFAKERRNFLV